VLRALRRARVGGAAPAALRATPPEYFQKDEV